MMTLRGQKNQPGIGSGLDLECLLLLFLAIVSFPSLYSPGLSAGFSCPYSFAFEAYIEFSQPPDSCPWAPHSDGRNDCAIADALMAVAQAVGNLNQRQEVDWLARFQRNNPPMFRGGYDPDGAVDWIFEVEKIFQAMECPLVQKVTLAAFMLSGDAGFWWQSTLQRMIAEGTQVNWDNFKRLFLEKYFPHDIRNKKQVEFLELKQGDDTVADYVSKFEALVRFCPTYEGVVNEEAKCVKFISGLRPEIKQVFNYQGIAP
ncbi:hypothetical protein CR513_06731, partial [Mucuna pruriens]